MRRPKACSACRARRRRCDIQSNQESCKYCSARGLNCVQELPPGGWYEQRAYDGGHHVSRPVSHRTQLSTSSSPRQTIGSASSPILTTSTPASTRGRDPGVTLPDLPLTLDLLELYFSYIHGQFHSLFHPATFIEDASRHEVPEPILLAIIGLVARFSDDPAFAHVLPQDRGRLYSLEAEKYFNIREISLETIQLGVLLGAAMTADGEAEIENVFYAVSCRMAQLIDLPRRLSSTILEREVNIRVWWSLCMIDVWSSTGVKLPRLLPIDNDVQYPMDDLLYASLRLTSTTTPIAPAPTFDHQTPLMHQMIKLNRILMQINDFNQAYATRKLDKNGLNDGVVNLGHKLDQWIIELPVDLRDTPENFEWCREHGIGRVFVALYLGYYHFGQLLYYQYLHVGHIAPSGTTAARYSALCKLHSAHLCDMIYRAFSAPGCDVRYTMVGHVLVIASSVQIHTLLLSDNEADIAVAKTRLQRNFEILLDLRSHWPTLDRSMSRLRAFHETCRKEMASSFVLDEWMLRFLVEFAEPMEEKGVQVAQDPAMLYSLDGLTAHPIGEHT